MHEDYLRMYRQMVRIRTFEDNANQLYLSAKMPGLTHMYSGEEAVAVGICEALTGYDNRSPRPIAATGIAWPRAPSSRRCSANCWARRKAIAAARAGRCTSPTRANGNLGANAIVGGSMGIATGSAFTRQTAGQGRRHRLLLRRRRHRAGPDVRGHEHGRAVEPAGHLCLREQRLFRIHQDREIAAGSITARAEAFGIEAHTVDGQDVLAVNSTDAQLVERCRKGEGPFFMELMTYRYHGHHVGDINREYYRSKDEEKDWKENKDPIIRSAPLTSEGIASEEELEAMNAEIKADATAAVEYALKAKYPDASEVDMHVYAA
jgi:TPP-dependent pyruvate/acetoin dehydrogenase alpha subunit